MPRRLLRSSRLLLAHASRNRAAVLAAGVLATALGVGTWWAIDADFEGAVRLTYAQVDAQGEQVAHQTRRVLSEVERTAVMVRHEHRIGGSVDAASLATAGLTGPLELKVSLVDPAGHLLGGDTLSPSAALDDALAAANVKKRTVFSAPVRDASGQRWQVYAATPLVPLDELRPAAGSGAVVVTFDPAVLTSGRIQDADRVVGLAGADGTYLSRLHRGLHTAGERLDAEQLKRSAERVQKATRPMYPIKSPVDGVARFGSVMRVDDLDVYAIVAIPAEQALAKHAQYRRQAIAAAGLTGMLLVLVCALLARQALLLRRSLDAQRRVELRLFHEKELLEVTLRAIGDGVVTTDLSGRITFLNRSAEQLCGRAGQQSVGCSVQALFRLADGQSGENLTSPVDAVLAQGIEVNFAGDTTLLCDDGQHRMVQGSATPLFDRSAEMVGAVMVLHDVGPSRKLAQELSYQSTHDVLTTLLNRTAFESRIDALLDADPPSPDPHVLMLLDLDQFKVVNDTCGHTAGDMLLKRVSELLGHTVRRQDTLARLGGDEFAVLLETCPLEPALRHADAIRQQVRNLRFTWEEHSFQLGVSIGLVPFTVGQYSRSELLRIADSACYVAKDAGRDRTHVYDTGDTAVANRNDELGWYSKLQKALAEDRFVLYVQHIESIQSARGDVGSAEVLLRLKDENGGIVPPGVFIPAAERYGLMPAIDRWVVRRALAQHAGFSRQFDRPMRLSINLCGASLSDPSLSAFVAEELRVNDVPPELVCFEVTETAAIENFDVAVQLIESLRGLGCRFALDDFGAGMSSFAYLKRLPVDSVKIDGAFVKDMVRDGVDYAMVEAINNIAHRMGLYTVAEFVENGETIEALRALGVDYVQGYGVDKPHLMSMAPAPVEALHGI